MRKMTSGVWVAIGAAAVTCAGSLGPWASALGQTLPGTEMDGVITLVLGLLALGALWAAAATANAWPVLITLVLGLVVTAIAVIGYVDIEDTEGLARQLADDEDLISSLEILANADRLRSAAWGIYLVIVGGIALAIASAVAWLERGRHISSTEALVGSHGAAAG